MERDPLLATGAITITWCRALVEEPSIGLLLPCNVVVREDEAGAVHVEMMDPAAVLDLVGNPDVNDLAAEVRSRLERVLAALL
jgi:uncharacterized protein (DUF302 family)